MSYGKDYIITESQAKEIRSISADLQKEEKRKILTIRRKIEAYQAERELNNERTYQ